MANGNTFPGPALPFGMVQLNPNTDQGVWDMVRGTTSPGYLYTDSTMIGFSHTQLSGTGCPDYGNFMIMPFTGEIKYASDDKTRPETTYSSYYRHDREHAEPGYYRVRLDDYDIEAELTATMRAGFHRYTFPESSQSRLVFDVGRSLSKTRDSYVEILSDTELAGYVSSGSMCGRHTPFTIYFYAKIDKPFLSSKVFRKGQIVPGTNKTQGAENTGVFLQYRTARNEQLQIKVGVSFVSIEGARNNLNNEIPDWDFDRIHRLASQTWEQKLQKIQVKGGSEEDKIKFYTALYNSFLFPRTFSDTDGTFYSHFIDRVHQMPDGDHYYVDFSLWDTYRTLHPLYTIIAPERQSELIRSLLVMYDHSGRLPLRVTYMNHHTNIMIGDHAVPVITDSYLKGIRDYDVEKAYEAIRLNAMVPGLEEMSRDGLPYYKTMGFIPTDRVREGTSITLENSFVDWTISQMARDLGKDDDYRLFLKRSQNYRNVFDPETRFMRPRLRHGEWVRECDEGEIPQDVSSVTGHRYYNCFHPLWIGHIPHRHFVESNAWQYLTYVPHDVRGLMELLGGEEAFIARLDSIFLMDPAILGPQAPDHTGYIGQYVQGNEPSHHVAYLFNYARQPWKTQYWVRYIMENLYGIEADGLPGNEDMGQMSAWYVMSAMGFYPVAPGQSVYQIGSPIFERITIPLGEFYDDKIFTIEASNMSRENKYIHSATLNGEPWNKTWLHHSDIVNGGILRFEMSNTPNKIWGSSPDSVPPSLSDFLD